MPTPALANTRRRYVEVCAGAGGWGLGLHRAGWTGTGLEMAAPAVETHRRNVGPCLQCDVTLVSPPHGADLVCGGVPCQPFSIAGRREGLDDPRGHLFGALLRLAGEADARAVAMENVRGLVWLGALPLVLEAFRNNGFEPVYSLLNAADYGVPQARVRLFIVGFRDAWALRRFRWPAPTHGAPGNILGLPPWRTMASALGLASGIADVLDAPSLTVTAGGVGAESHTGGAEVFFNPQYRAKVRAALRLAGLLDRPATTVDCNGSISAAGHHVSNKAGAVSLPPRAVAAIQGFPGDFAFTGTRREQHLQAGNALPPTLGEVVSRAIGDALYG